MRWLCRFGGCLVVFVAIAASASAESIVYVGTDVSDHYGTHPQAITLTQNVVRFAGGNSDPIIGLVGNGSSFGGNTPGLLATAGFTNVTLIAPGNLGTTDLSAFQMLYFAPTTLLGDTAAFAAAAGQVLAFVNAGGGLVVEPEVFAAGSWNWVPYAGLLGHSGATNVGDERVVLNGAADPALLAGLSNAGLSGWGYSVHTTFSTYAAAGFTALTWDGSSTGPGHIIYRQTSAPEPASALLLVLGAAAVGWTSRRRRKAAR